MRAKTKKLNYKKGALIALLMILLGFLIARPDRYIASVFQGILLFCTAVLPALFPFFFFTKILTFLGAGDLFSKAFRSPIKKIYHAPPSAAYIFVMSMLSGYPVGAKLLDDFYTNGLIDERQARGIAAFTSTSGPLFIVGTVASGMFQSRTLGYWIMLCHFLAALINGLIYRPRKKADDKDIPEKKIPPLKQDDILAESIYQSIISVLTVGGYIAIFSLIADILIDLNVISFLAWLPAKAFESAGLDGRFGSGIIIGLLEVTRGCLEVGALSPSAGLALPIAAGLISFGGICILLQSVTFLSKCKIKMRYFFCTKCTHALITVVLALPLAFLI